MYTMKFKFIITGKNYKWTTLTDEHIVHTLRNFFIHSITHKIYTK